MHRDSWRFHAYLAGLFLSSLAIGRVAMNDRHDARLQWFLLCLLCVAATMAPMGLGRCAKVFRNRRYGGRHSADTRVGVR
jgi:NADH:ubiquinone oxidoreductase subunit K